MSMPIIRREAANKIDQPSKNPSVSKVEKAVT